MSKKNRIANRELRKQQKEQKAARTQTVPGLTIIRTEVGALNPIGPSRPADCAPSLLIGLVDQHLVMDNATILDELCPLDEVENLATTYEQLFGVLPPAELLREAMVSLSIGDIEYLEFSNAEGVPVAVLIPAPGGMVVGTQTPELQREGFFIDLLSTFEPATMLARIKDKVTLADLAAEGASIVALSERGANLLPQLLGSTGEVA